MAWTADQIEYLESKIGQMSAKRIAEVLGKKAKCMESYRKRNGVPSGREAADGISVTAFAEAMGRCTESIYDWIDQKGLPVKRIPVGIKGTKEVFIDMEKFWKWAYKNKHFIDFSKIEKGTFGVEPEWVARQRYLDRTDWGKKGWDKPWTKEEDIRLCNLLKLQRYTYRQLSDMMQRTELAIQGRLYQINEKLRPLPEPRKAWSKEDVKQLTQLVFEGYTAFQIGKILDRSELQIKAKVARL